MLLPLLVGLFIYYEINESLNNIFHPHNKGSAPLNVSVSYPFTLRNNKRTLNIRCNCRFYLNTYNTATKARIQYLNKVRLVIPCAWEINDPDSFGASSNVDLLKEFCCPTKINKVVCWIKIKYKRMFKREREY